MWAHNAGFVESEAEFQDIYGIDDDLLKFVPTPEPVKVVVLLFLIRGKLEDLRKREEEINERCAAPVVPPVFWVKQTISSACRTIGPLHVLTNVRWSQLVFESEVKSLHLSIPAQANKTPLERAQFLESTDPFANIHAAAASGGQTAVPNDWDTDLHFTCFVQAPEAFAREAEIATGERRLIELDGGRAGSGDRGNLTDQLKDVATTYVKEQIIPKAPSLEFSMIALAGGLSEVESGGV